MGKRNHQVKTQWYYWFWGTATDAVCAVAFGGDKTVSSGTFTIQFPTADASDAILRIA